MRWIGALWLLALSAAPAAAASVKPGDSVPGHPGLTYLDLASEALPSLAANAADNGAIEGRLPDPAPRHLGGKTYDGDPPGPVTLGWMQDLRIVAGGQKRMLILADLGPDPDRAQSQTLLLLFDDGAKPKLLDMADVGVDLDTEFDEAQPTLPLGPGDEAIMTVSEHSDADLSYDGHVLLFVRQDRLQAIATFFLINSNACGWEQRQSVRLSTRPAPGRPYPDIDLRLVHRIQHNADTDCGGTIPKPVSRRFDALYRWNESLGQFTTTSKALKEMEKLTWD
jgi:hypothetical protein